MIILAIYTLNLFHPAVLLFGARLREPGHGAGSENKSSIESNERAAKIENTREAM
jgi:hypothetical protein